MKIRRKGKGGAEDFRERPLGADNHMSLATCLQRTGRYEEAGATYREAIRLTPGEPDLRRLLELCNANARATGRKSWWSWLS